MSDKELIIHSKSNAYKGFFKVDLVAFQHSLYRGGLSPVLTREIFGRGQAVVVLLYDTSKQKVVLVEQCRAGAMANHQDHQAWLIEPVAGMIDEGETPLDACEREVAEEASIEVTDFEYVCQFYPSPGGSSEVLHLYAAEIDSETLPEFSGLLHEGEDIRLIQLDFEQAKRRLLQGEFNVASTVIALQWLFFQKLVHNHA
jgi:ADP-ribose pyrophosphatase